MWLKVVFAKQICIFSENPYARIQKTQTSIKQTSTFIVKNCKIEAFFVRILVRECKKLKKGGEKQYVYCEKL